MLIYFTKMHGLGNDFMVVDQVLQNIRLSPEKIRQLGNRHFGVGFDQLLLVEPPTHPDMDFRYRIFNADGNEVEQCGNGARCFARFVHDKKLTSKERIKVQTAAGNIELNVHSNGDVTVDMGPPRLHPQQIPFTSHHAEVENIAEPASTYPLILTDGSELDVALVSMGNPHCVLLVDDIDQANVEQLGLMIQQHDSFPQQCNVGFMQIVDRDEIFLRVYERGVGETMACGTGACAAVVAGQRLGLLDDTVKAHLKGGMLTIKWQGGTASVFMTGSAVRVYEGYTRF